MVENMSKNFYPLPGSLKQYLFVMFSLLGCLLATQSYAVAENQPAIQHINISNHEFEFETYTASPGDTIEITNQSDISHSIYIVTAAGDIINIDEKLYVQTPGVSVKWQIPEPGEYTLKCWIHPSINATLIVPDSTDSSNHP